MGRIFTGLDSLVCGWGRMVRKYFTNYRFFALLHLLFLSFLSFFSQMGLMLLTLQCLSSPAKYFPLKRMCHKQNILFIHQQRQVNCKQFTTLHVSIFSSAERSKMTAEPSSGAVSAELSLAVRERFWCGAWTHPQPQKIEMQRSCERGGESWVCARTGHEMPCQRSFSCLGISPRRAGSSLPAKDTGQRSRKQREGLWGSVP